MGEVATEVRRRMQRHVAKDREANVPGPGRPTVYQPAMARFVRNVAMLRGGLAPGDVEVILGITAKRRLLWMRKHAEFKEACEYAGEDMDAEVVAALHRRAVGGTYKETRTTTRGRQKVTTVTEKEMPADTQAAVMWLKNRQGWSDRQTTTHEVGDTLAQLIQDMNDDIRPPSERGRTIDVTPVSEPTPVGEATSEPVNNA